MDGGLVRRRRLGAAPLMNLGIATLAICITVVLCTQGELGRPSMRQAIADWIVAQTQGCR